MNFQQLVQLGDQEVILTRELMDIGLLSRRRRCINQNRHEEEIIMRIDDHLKQWRCPRCTNKISVKSLSFFADSNLSLVTWIEVINHWVLQHSLADIKRTTNLSKTTIGQMLKSLREQCQGYLQDFPIEVGGPGIQVKIEMIKKCPTNNCGGIVLVKEQGKNYGYLLHNRDQRYVVGQGAENTAPVREGSMVFARQLFNLKANIAHSDAMELFQGNDEPNGHATNWLKERRGIPCSKVGGFVNEYNMRYFINQSEEGFADRFMRCVVRSYEDILHF
ncbi:uncharacterized protein [Clytia hemisphaerica]|uniref:Uncharacterized protein n=2 Tax=Clytia hemisphaerica TaxID=252671 RepID=A0A7M5V615_9CNID